jgi:hypothetical protein
MSVYRQATPARPALLAAIALVALLVGLGIGLLVGGGGEQPSLRTAVDGVRSDMRPALESLDVLPIEYAQGVRGGRVVARTEYEGARGHLARARAAFDGARGDLALLAPAETAALRRELDDLGRLVRAHAPPGRVEAAAREASALVRRALREPPD